MSTLILDECLQNLYYAQEAMKEWIPMTEYEVIFEAVENSETADKLAKNEATATKSTNFVKKAIDAVIALIKRIYQTIKDFIDRCTMNGAEREAFEDFRATMAKDPSMKNKKVTVADFRKIEAEYDRLLNEIDQNIRAVKADEKHPIENISKKVTDFVKGTATAVSVTVAADAALKMADSNVAMAKVLQKTLRDEEGVMEGLMKALGKKDAVKFQKEIDAAAKNTMLHRLKVTLFRHKYDNAREVVQSTIRAMSHAGFRDAKVIKGEMKDLKKDLKSGNIDKEDYKNQKKDLKKELSNAKKDQKESIKLDKKLLDNENLSPIAKTVASSAASGLKEAIKDKVSETGKSIRDKTKKTVKKLNPEKRDGTGIYKSGLDFITGR